MSKIGRALDEKVRRRAKQRCEYCLNPQWLIPHKLEIEHSHPKSLGGANSAENLGLACRECNGHKAMRVSALDPTTGKTVNLFNPRKQSWHEHFALSQDKTEIVGITACGRATVESLQMNSVYQKTTRKIWVKAGLFPHAIDAARGKHE